MSSRPRKRWSGWLAGTLSLWLAGAAAAALAPASTEFFQPQEQTDRTPARDPFVQPEPGQLKQVTEQVAIETLRLTGIIRNPQRATALFVSQTGPHFVFILKNGRLYRENHQVVPGVTGAVLNPKEVVLQQADHELKYRLRLD